jgi:hypothetical protein
MAHFVDFNSLKQKDESSATEVKEIKIVIADDASENLCQVLNEHKPHGRSSIIKVAS